MNLLNYVFLRCLFWAQDSVSIDFKKLCHEKRTYADSWKFLETDDVFNKSCVFKHNMCIFELFMA